MEYNFMYRNLLAGPIIWNFGPLGPGLIFIAGEVLGYKYGWRFYFFAHPRRRYSLFLLTI
jgi:hypothetical protein